jgi:hypothetical protein
MSDMNQKVMAQDAVDPRRVSMVSVLASQITWSAKTFGTEARKEGLLRHIERECNEVRTAESGGSNELSEWIDIVMLALDGAWRREWSSTFYTTNEAVAEEVVTALLAKMAVNQAREWPAPGVPEDQPVEHVVLFGQADRRVDVATLIDEARSWLRENYPPTAGDLESKDKFNQSLGLLVDFITDKWPKCVSPRG